MYLVLLFDFRAERIIRRVTNNDKLSNMAPNIATGNPMSTYSSPLSDIRCCGYVVNKAHQ